MFSHRGCCVGFALADGKTVLDNAAIRSLLCPLAQNRELAWPRRVGIQAVCVGQCLGVKKKSRDAHELRASSSCYFVAKCPSFGPRFLFTLPPSSSSKDCFTSIPIPAVVSCSACCQFQVNWKKN